VRGSERRNRGTGQIFSTARAESRSFPLEWDRVAKAKFDGKKGKGSFFRNLFPYARKHLPGIPVKKENKQAKGVNGNAW